MMAIEKTLQFTVPVEDGTNYEIKVRIGDAQEGSHVARGNCPYTPDPTPNEPEWIAGLGIGSEIRNKKLKVITAIQNTNPDTNFISVRLFINGEHIEPNEGEYSFEVDELEYVYFTQKIEFV